MSNSPREQLLQNETFEKVVIGKRQSPLRENAINSADVNSTVRREPEYQARSMLYTEQRKHSSEQNGEKIALWIQPGNAYESRTIEEDLPELQPSKSGEKLSKNCEETEQEVPFMPKRFPQLNCINCSDLSLKLSSSSDTSEEIDCTVTERGRSVSFADTSSNRNTLANSPRLVSRPCSILVSADPAELTEKDNCNVQPCNSKLFEECHATARLHRSVNMAGWENHSPNDPGFILSSFPDDAGRYYGYASNLIKSEEACFMSDVDRSENLKQKAASHGRSRTSGFRALDLLVRAIQVTTGYLLGDEDDDFPESFAKDNLHDRKGMLDPQLSAGERKLGVVKKRVLRRAKSAFKKPLIQESVADSEPKRGRKRKVSELHQVGDAGLKIKLSIIGAQTTFEDEVPLMRSKHRRSQNLPTKFYDSMLQTWTRKSRRQLKLKL